VDTDVLIVGAGPTGLMLANQLVRQGVRTLIIDRHDGPALQTRALGVQARTLEIYSHLGIAERAVELGKRATGANLWAQGRRTARVPLGDIGRDLSPYPYLLILGQDDNERLLGEALRDRGMSVQWSTELVGLAQDADRVTARLQQPDGTVREVTAVWVAGCDGAGSAVRQMSGIAFQGAPYEHVFFVADTQVTGPMVPDELNVYLWRDGFHLFFPMRGADHWRIVGILPAALRERDLGRGRGRDDVTLDDVVPSIRQEAPGVSVQGSSWFSTYRIHHRRAERFRERRCFLLGDAAHVHSPVGAQGMNTGLQDAYNLGWKLALVVAGRAAPSLLDSYEAERIPVAERLLSTTDRAFTLAVSDSRLAGLARTTVFARVVAVAMRVRRIRELAFRTISQIGIRYPDSALSETLPGLPRGGPRAGDRFPWLRLKLGANGPPEDLFGRLDDTRFTLVLIGQATSPALPADLLRTLLVPPDPANDRELARAGIPRRAFYLVRPDGYVGLAGTGLDAAALTGYLSQRLGLCITRA
jgi:2-polyprenyl-6-methoxyphenol hydroxylase-like FAD-dependent oxidoreductase